MRVRLTVEVDAKAWREEFGTDDVRSDVESWLMSAIDGAQGAYGSTRLVEVVRIGSARL